MRRRLSTLAATLALLVAMLPAAPAAAFVPSAGLYENSGGGTPKCVGFTGAWPSLTTACSTSWANRARAISASLLTGQCARFWMETSYGSTSVTLYGPRAHSQIAILTAANQLNVESLRADGTGTPGTGCSF